MLKIDQGQTLDNYGMQIVASEPVGSDTTPVFIMGGCYLQDHIRTVIMYVHIYIHMQLCI